MKVAPSHTELCHSVCAAPAPGRVRRGKCIVFVAIVITDLPDKSPFAYSWGQTITTVDDSQGTLALSYIYTSFGSIPKRNFSGLQPLHLSRYLNEIAATVHRTLSPTPLADLYNPRLRRYS